MNRNGIQEPNEPPMANVLVELYESNGNYLTYTTTDATGRYYVEGVEPQDNIILSLIAPFWF